MSRNGSGTYTVPNTFLSGSTITASGENENFDDLGLEITNSVAADGQTSMSGALKASSGTALAPSLTFAADTDTGFYRVSANVVGVAQGGVGSPITAFPSGTLMLFQQTTAPTGWTKQTTHNDKALRVVSGTASSGGSTAFSTVFAQSNTGNHVLIMGELPVHNIDTSGFGISDPGHPHLYGSAPAGGFSGGGAGITAGASNATSTDTTGITLAGTLPLGGSGNPHTHPISLVVQYVDLIIASKD